jgi:hypothetical protein
MFKVCRLPSGSPCLFLGRLKIHLTKSKYWEVMNLNSALYIEVPFIEIKWKKNYKGHSIY